MKELLDKVISLVSPRWIDFDEEPPKLGQRIVLRDGNLYSMCQYTPELKSQCAGKKYYPILDENTEYVPQVSGQTIFISSQEDALTYAKAKDMASFIFELVYNGWKEFENSDYDHEPAWKKIDELLKKHGIDIDYITW